jgi:hypothetical protein
VRGFQNQISNPYLMCRGMKRNRSKPHSFEVQLAEAAAMLKAQAHELQPGKQRDELLRKLRQIDTAAHLNEWLKSPGLRPPK